MASRTTSPHHLTNRELEILERLANGLSDQQIAGELCLSLNTIKWHNRQIYGKLGAGSRTQAVKYAHERGVLTRAGAAVPASGRANQLPVSLTPFIGRGRELAEVKHLLREGRLLTLTGTGGAGKTRLALRVAAEVGNSFADGVCFVDLATLTDHTLVPNAIAGALGSAEQAAEPPLTTLQRVLAGQELLLLLDNFEHVLPAARIVSELRATLPLLTVLVTSREPLRLTGEQEYPVPPLSLPTAETVSRHTLAASEAGALFLQRARMTVPHFAVSDDSAVAIARICHRLDGLPLAIELAAARCKLLTPRVLLERLEQGQASSTLGVLARGPSDAPLRHRTLRDTMDWSYHLLDEQDQILFARLAVFRGGLSLAAFEAVCGTGPHLDPVAGLASLVDKSLVQRREMPGAEPRFVLLELIHEYARERLEAGGEAEDLRRRHATYFVELAERAEPELRLAAYDEWCQRFELELENLRAALDWSIRSGEVTLGIRLAGALCLFWHGKGRHVEGNRWMELLLERIDRAPLEYHPKFLISAGIMAWFRDLDTARRLFTSALATARALDDRINTAWALAYLSYPMMRDPEVAVPLAESGLALFRELNHPPGIALALNVIGELARLNGDDGRARRAYEECLTVTRRTGEIRRLCYIYNNLAFIAQHAGDHEQALALARQSLRLARDRGDRRDMAEALVIVAGSFGALRQPGRAARLLGAAEAALERMGALRDPGDVPEYERMVAGVRAQLDDERFAALWTAGRRLTLEQAVAAALAGQA